MPLGLRVREPVDELLDRWLANESVPTPISPTILTNPPRRCLRSNPEDLTQFSSAATVGANQFDESAPVHEAVEANRRFTGALAKLSVEALMPHEPIESTLMPFVMAMILASPRHTVVDPQITPLLQSC